MLFPFSVLHSAFSLFQQSISSMEQTTTQQTPDSTPTAHSGPTTPSLHSLMTTPQMLFTHFCEEYQKKYTNVQLSTLTKNNTMQSDFLYGYYETVIQPNEDKADIQNDEDFLSLLAFYTDHMSNVRSECPANINSGKGQTTTIREARTASFQYCLKLLPQIQKKLLTIND